MPLCLEGLLFHDLWPTYTPPCIYPYYYNELNRKVNRNLWEMRKRWIWSKSDFLLNFISSSFTFWGKRSKIKPKSSWRWSMIRSVQVKDAGQIRDLCHQVLGYDSTLEKVAAQIDKFNQPDSGHFALFMKRTKQAIFLVMWRQKFMKVFIVTLVWIFWVLAVFPSAQGRGIGRQLMERVEELAKSKHYALSV